MYQGQLNKAISSVKHFINEALNQAEILLS